MHWRLTRSQYEERKGVRNRQAFRRLVHRSATPPGVVAFVNGEPVGWCAVAPREEYSTLGRSRILKPVDERPVWSIVCFFVDREFRGQGISRVLIRGAVDLAREHGATIVESYPVEPKKKPMPVVFAFTGLASAFRREGFREVARHSETRPILRRTLRPATRKAGGSR